MINTNIISKIVDGDLSDPKSRIAKAAIEEFAMRSLDGARTRKIAEKSGVNLASISYYFGGKRNLYKIVIEQLSSFFDEAVAPYYDEGRQILKKRNSKDAMLFVQKFLIDCIRKFSKVEIVAPLCQILTREQDNPSEYFKCAYAAIYEKPVEFLSDLLAKASKEKLARDMRIVFAHTLWATVRTYAAESPAVMRLHSWSKFGESELSLIEKSLNKVLEKTLNI